MYMYKNTYVDIHAGTYWSHEGAVNYMYDNYETCINWMEDVDSGMSLSHWQLMKLETAFTLRKSCDFMLRFM